MTEYEMANLFGEWVTYSEAYFETFIGLLFAFLIASYLVSSKLTRPMVVIVIFSFTAVEINYIYSFWGSSADMASLAAKIGEAKAADNPHLDWMFGSGQSLVGSFELQLKVQSVIMMASYIAALAFFFYTRHHPREV